jgi:hypothetical protein
MGVANPIWLWGMFGLMVPIAIHLLSRKDMRVIHVGSLRHLEHTTTRQAIRIHLNAYLLLALRCLIVALAAMILAGVYLSNQTISTRWLLVEGNLGQETKWRSFIDSLEAEGYESRRLQEGFPLVAENEEDHSIPDYWKLYQQLSDMQLDRCIVISHDRIVGFSGSQPSRNANITWLTAPSKSARFVLIAARTPGDSVVMRVGQSNETLTSFQTLRLPASQERAAMHAWSDASNEMDTLATAPRTNVPASDVALFNNVLPPVRVVLSGTTIADEERRVIRAAVRAIDENGILRVALNETHPSDVSEGDWLIWLSADEPPASKITNVIRRSPDLQGTEVRTTAGRHNAPLIVRAQPCGHRAQGAGGNEKIPDVADEADVSNCWTITQLLTPSAALSARFTLQLATLLLDDANRKLNGTARPHDRRQLPDTEIFSAQAVTAAKRSSPEKRGSAGDVLAIVLVLLLATERFIANRQQL